MKTILNIIILLFVTSTQMFSEKISLDFITSTNDFLQEHVQDGRVNYKVLSNNPSLEDLVQQIANADLDAITPELEQAFYINAYNLSVIHLASKSYPQSSVQNIAGFFERKNINLAGQKVSLNQIEKDFLFKKFGDPRYHFVLVCGALGCPPITAFAYHPDQLEQQLEKQTQIALNDKGFIAYHDGVINLSQIFNWYAKDFGNTKTSIIQFINKYRDLKIPVDGKINYIDYDWSLNDFVNSTGGVQQNLGNNASRYIVSSTIKKGAAEIKIFNNLYSQENGSEGQGANRSSFFTTSLSALYGLSNRFNIGINTRFRKVSNHSLPSSAFDLFSNNENISSKRNGLTAIGPQVRYAPNPKWKNFSIQSSFVFAIGQDLAGSASEPYIDWNGPTWNTQFFNDFAIGNSFSLFTEVDILWEDIGRTENNHNNRVSTPVTLIFSYNPLPNLNVYTLGGFSPYWQSEFDYFTQVGIGAKYQFTPKLEIELLYTDFSNKSLNQSGGQAATYNVGFRFNL